MRQTLVSFCKVQQKADTKEDGSYVCRAIRHSIYPGRIVTLTHRGKPSPPVIGPMQSAAIYCDVEEIDLEPGDLPRVDGCSAVGNAMTQC